MRSVDKKLANGLEAAAAAYHQVKNSITLAGETSWRRSSDDDGSARGTSEQSTSFPPYSFNATDREKQ